MIINQSVGFVFIHIPKSAGTSISRFLAPLNGPFDLEIGGTVFGEEIQPAYWRRHKLRKHMTLAQIYGAISSARPVNDIFFFTLVRNPYTRLLSIFSFLRKWEKYDPDLLRLMKSFENFEEFVNSGLYTKIPGVDQIFRPQSYWLKIDGELPPYLRCFQIENIDAHIETIRNELLRRGADSSKLTASLPHLNRSESPPVNGLNLSKEMIAKINEFYAEDFEAFGYKQATSTWGEYVSDFG